MRQNGLFITGTDTGVGKTMVAAGLVRLARRMGLDAVAVKPVETGCKVKEGELFPEDGHFLWEACERVITLDDCVPFRFALPAAPYRAAVVAGSRLYPQEIREHIEEVASRADLTAVEGAGGLFVPIHDTYCMIDLIADLGFPVLLVARSRLGTLNHTMLSLEALRHRGLSTVGILISFVEAQPGPEEEFVVGDMRRLISDIPVYSIPHFSEEVMHDPENIAAQLREIIPHPLLLKWFGLSQ